MQKRRQLIIILLIHVTEVLGFSIILPFLPLLAQDMGASAFVIGLILTTYSLFQFLSAPVMGRLSDMFGRRPLLIISQLSTFVSFMVLGFSTTLWMVFISRIIDGLFGSNFTIAQAYLSDISTKEERSKYFGYTGVAFGIGFFIGPAIGGYFSQFGFAIPSFLAAGAAMLTIILTYVFLPETVEKKARTLNVKIIDVQAFRRYFADPVISGRLWQFFAFISSMMLYVSSFALFANAKYGYSARDVGYVLAYVGFISIVLRGYFIPKLIDRFGEGRLLLNGVYAMTIGLLLITITSQSWMFFVATTFFAYGTGVIRPLLMGAISRAASPHEQGAVVGTANSLASIAQIHGPLIGGFVLTSMAPSVLSLLSTVVIGIGLVMILREHKSHYEA